MYRYDFCESKVSTYSIAVRLRFEYVCVFCDVTYETLAWREVERRTTTTDQPAMRRRRNEPWRCLLLRSVFLLLLLWVDTIIDYSYIIGIDCEHASNSRQSREVSRSIRLACDDGDLAGGETRRGAREEQPSVFRVFVRPNLGQP